MSKQKDSGALIALDKAVNRWDYDTSVSKMRPMVKQWKKATIEMARELYLAKEFLTSQKGQYKDPEADDYLLYSWSSYCKEIGLTYQTANNWLKPFEPKELSETGKDNYMFEPPVKIETTANRALSESRITEYLRTGVRPNDWTNAEESEAKRRMENARYAALAEKYDCPAIPKARKDYFSGTMSKMKDIINFELDSGYQTMAQLKVFDYTEEYLNLFDDVEIRIKAAFNLALKTRNIANELAENYYKSIGSAPAKNEENDGE